MDIAIVGGGAAGFFAAISVKENYPNARVAIFEKTSQVLAKVKVSGGGRCNVTNACSSIADLCKAYPRGSRLLKKLFHEFNTIHARQWFEMRGVQLVVQPDDCIFPRTQSSQTIIDCFLQQVDRLGISIITNAAVSKICPQADQLELIFKSDRIAPQRFDKVIVTTGGSPQRSGLHWLEELGHKIEPPVPSLFSFSIPNNPVTQLMGIVVETAVVSLPKTKLTASGALLITHWGMSGPAILKLSSFAARTVSDANYEFPIQINWIGESNNDLVQQQLNNCIEQHANKQIGNKSPFELSSRLWHFLLEKSEIDNTKRWGDVGKKACNKLINSLTNDSYRVKGRTAFREEFVTCGGVSLDNIDSHSMQSTVCPNLYFAGEVLDIDAITGGFNFQAAWTTAFIAAQLRSIKQ